MPTDFAAADLPRADVSTEQAARLLAERYGLTGSLRELGSQQDRNFALTAGDRHYLLKVAHPAFGRAELESQVEAMRELTSHAMVVQEPVPGLDGAVLQEVRVGGRPLTAYLMSFLDGETLSGQSYLAPVVVARLGELGGQVVRALRSFTHPGTARTLQWDLRHGVDVVSALAPTVADRSERERLTALAAAADARLAPLRADLRETVIHGDLTGDNVVCRRDDARRLVPYGIIDLGDLHRGWLVAELAVTCASLVHHFDETPLDVLPAVRAFAGLVPLDSAEVAALWPLIALRAAVLGVSDAQQLAIDPDNAYVSAQRDRQQRLLEAVTSVPFDVAEEAVRDALGMPSAHHATWPPQPASAASAASASAAATRPMVPALVGPGALGVCVVDLSVTSEALHAGRWLEPGIEAALVDEAVRSAPVGDLADRAALLRWGEHRLTRSGVDQRLAPATFALDVELHLPEATPVCAPFDGVIGRDGERVVLVANGFDIIIGGITGKPDAGTAVVAGSIIGRSAAGAPVTVQVCLARGVAAPRLTTPDLARAWARLCPDPSPLLGLDCAAATPDTRNLLERRDKAFATVQEHYYADPPQVERGWQHHLVDTTARCYVDMVNNVTSIGHGHPRLVRDLTRQWSLLNTNSRFHYALLTELSERLAAKAPEGLDTVLLVNSGSEAVDLALRIAQAATGRKDVLAVEEGYHGWTFGADAVTSSLADNPNALDTRPDWVHLVSAPNAYRGVHRGADAGPAYVRDVEAVLQGLAERGVELAAYIAEPFYGNAGGVPLPPGYLEGVYAAVRAVGGLCIADEVQVGYGRLGRWFWGVEQQGVVPDLITVAKAMGNGHPLGAVITRREIAESLAAEGHFFSSAGGSPVSCRAGLTVLDVLADEDLQGNAERVGGHLIHRLEELATRHRLIGAVHGSGLYVGVEMVRDRETLEPATQETSAICDRLLELGVILQPTGDRRNVLKIKPPLCITAASADFFVDRLDEVLTDGW